MRKSLKIGGPILAVSASLLLSGCGLGFGKEEASKQIDPPPALSHKKETQPKSKATAASEKNKVKRQLYLFDSNGLVVPQMLPLPKSGMAAKQVLQYLVKDGPVTQMLPNGFQAVLPTDTRVLDVTVEKDGTAVANFSKEFKEYRAQDERKLLQAITFTLTQFEAIKTVKIQIEGHDQKDMPLQHTPIGEGVSRSDGINIENGAVTNMAHSNTATLYFVAQNSSNTTYYVPVTRRIAVNENQDAVAAAVQELIEGPTSESHLLSDVRNDVKLMNKPVVKDGVVTLNFNKAILGNKAANMIDDEVLKPLVLSLTEIEGVKKVAIQVDGKASLKNQAGKSLTAPVSRTEIVETGEF
ncbi:Lipoprotein LpqB, GerMN domain-containing protein [Fictibacillus macauensis ZFHKF-1]|uniref:Lipoprotein LpqB, GerMN domain-containing protein n=1 Tax=Fictibacillus macauensis ZFHKF-1 TaxID=1196324 RepID=I8UEZ7_9BACL|nr:GerMN domain-containing protein [Fictibacillus macauensis]EIT85393.1 Lipoprotein LpqB, GerMN domain-containing protein [Fictibacillus macauensis ZFHKF-1]